jgi:hypothetical protein
MNGGFRETTSRFLTVPLSQLSNFSAATQALQNVCNTVGRKFLMVVNLQCGIQNMLKSSRDRAKRIYFESN